MISTDSTNNLIPQNLDEVALPRWSVGTRESLRILDFINSLLQKQVKSASNALRCYHTDFVLREMVGSYHSLFSRSAFGECRFTRKIHLLTVSLDGMAINFK
ncbi:MAG: hypothetical protein JW996_03915 [Candidatus Cloacimonetes bacterium]|nr:hypothetical protein [Candidatus Cloacimonadota bacterium]